MTIAEFSITPIGKGASISEYVARCVDLVDRSGMAYRLNPMGTVVEGPLDEVVALILRCHRAVATDCERVSTLIKIDDRRDADNRMRVKVDAVEERLGRPLRT